MSEKKMSSQRVVVEKQIEDIFDKEKIETPKEEIKNLKKEFFLFRFFKGLFLKKSNQNQLNKYAISEPVS